MSTLSTAISHIPELSMAFFGGAPVVYHCNHFNLFLDQTVDDALGVVRGVELRTHAAHEASHQLLRGLNRELGADTASERLELAATVFAAMGHGHLHFDASAKGGEVSGKTLHYGTCWSEKYGDLVRRHEPTDAVAAGFAAAAVELAHELEPGSMVTTEYECVAMRAPACKFHITDGGHQRFGEPVGLQQVLELAGSSEQGMFAEEIDEVEVGLLEFLTTLEPDARGLIQGFGVFVTRHLASYYNHITYSTYTDLVARAPSLGPVAIDLFRESGHVCVFNTFGGIMLSPEWEALVGQPDGDPRRVLAGCVSIARALGFGRWTVAEFEPGERLVLRTPLTYEHPWLVVREPDLKFPAAFFLQGAALAFMQLIEEVDWRARPSLTQSFYERLFRGGTPWRVEQTQGIRAGDRVCEIVVSRST